MYPDYMQDSLKAVVRTRSQRLNPAKSGEPVYPPMGPAEREDVLRKFHPDYEKDSRRPVRVGPNKGEILTTEVAHMLEAHSWISSGLFDLREPDLETDLLIVGGGGAGCQAAIVALQAGVKSLIATKLRMGDANSMMSQGGMQAAVSPTDSPTRHFLDALGGGDDLGRLGLHLGRVGHGVPEVFGVVLDEEVGVMHGRAPVATWRGGLDPGGE